jgi:hypothetical protein
MAEGEEGGEDEFEKGMREEVRERKRWERE